MYKAGVIQETGEKRLAFYLENAGHEMFIDNPKDVNNAILDFLKN